MKEIDLVLQQREADIAHVRKEIESLQIVAPLLSDEAPSDELTKKPASSEETLDQRGEGSELTGPYSLFSSVSDGPREKFWKILKRKM